ncbi:hypothetical protein S40285_00142 [Stachybotrys chlorohalonatus IBT 40285]|uniref:Sas10 C-terminal domain-containing protein n=1 Tax=Stachybotrys chlorohalonatus (strain IBT 40285) TaxID=1283841 RepID=A0A084QTZ8_STAC4|nr:hypothetical protein S40285_00142 [Stachybotrys chlorohalonata IBT 40285]
MAKKRKASGRGGAPSGPRDVDPADARIGPIATYEDVADSEDEYFINRDKIMLDDGPDSKRRRKDEDDDMELSEEEILGYDDSDESDAQDAEEEAQMTRAPKGSTAKGSLGQDEDDEEGGQGDEGDEAWWGSSRKEYYDADKIETEADALEEEAEAKRLQQKKLSKMAEEDFVFDGDEWLATQPSETQEQEPRVEVLKDIEISEDMGSEERFELLQTRYPEFNYLAKEFQELQPVLQDLRKQAEATLGTPVQAVQYRTLGCYIAALASYFAILTSPARDGSKAPSTVDPAELRDHDVMATLVSCRAAWQRASQLKSAGRVSQDKLSPQLSPDVGFERSTSAKAVEPSRKKKPNKDKLAAEKLAKKLERATAIEHTVADLYDLPLPIGSKKGGKHAKIRTTRDEDAQSDFGEETSLDARTAAEKAARKKSLKFYTSQIVQKSNRRTDAGRDAGGDMDIPYRERLKDRQARLLAEAERRGKTNSKHGAALGDGSDEEDTSAADALRKDEDEYYDMVAQKTKEKNQDKAARFAAYAAASKADRVVEKEEIGEDGKRKITYAIQKNKGLTPKRSKAVRNPRVKKRMQYDAKQKKLSSIKAVYKGGEPKGGYSGERSGINTGVVKSIKL